MFAKDQPRESRSNNDCCPMGTATLVSIPNAVSCRPANTTTRHIRDSPPCTLEPEASTQPKTQVDCMSHIRRQYEEQNISDDAISLITASWRTSTQAQCNTYITKWFQFCSRWEVNPTSPALAEVADYLTIMFREGLSYSTINMARSALSCLGIKIDSVAVGAHPTICRLMKGIYNTKPPRAKYEITWDVDIVLRHLKAMQSNQLLSLKDLTFKLNMILALTLAARPQTLIFNINR